jgi:hypothetical protein
MLARKSNIFIPFNAPHFEARCSLVTAFFSYYCTEHVRKVISLSGYQLYSRDTAVMIIAVQKPRSVGYYFELLALWVHLMK